MKYNVYTIVFAEDSIDHTVLASNLSQALVYASHPIFSRLGTLLEVYESGDLVFSYGEGRDEVAL